MKPVIRPFCRKDNKSEIYNFFISKYIPLIESYKTGNGEVGVTVPIPVFATQDLVMLTQTATALFKMQPSLLNLKPGIVVIGDLHGNLFNLLHVFSQHGLPPEQNYLFLGNIVNFGEFSLETISLILAFFCAYPNNVSILRGDSEMYPIQSINSLHDEIKNVYQSNDLFQAFQTTFSFMPLAAMFNNTIFCTQCSTLTRFQSVKNIIHQKGPTLCESNADGFLDFVSSIKLPDEEWMATFLDENNIEIIILGGNIEETGVSTLYDDRVYTISSCETTGAAGAILLTGNLKPSPVIFISHSTLIRSNALFLKMEKSLKAPTFPTATVMTPSKNGRFVSRSPSLKKPNIIIPSKSPITSSVMKIRSTTPNPLGNPKITTHNSNVLPV